jgi:ADP-ribose pyrophosphatase
MARLPITLEKRTLLRENAVFRVYADHVRDAAGCEITDYLAVVPRHRTAAKVSGVAVLPVLDGKLGLISVYRYPLGEKCWEVPRGFVDAQETPETAAARELAEETSLESPLPLVPLGVIAPEPAVIDAKVALFAAHGCRPHPAAAGASEMGHGELRFFTREEAVSLVAEGAVLDPYTIVILLKLLGCAAALPA